MIFIFLLVGLHLTARYCSRYSGVYTYYCKEMNFTFQILNKDTCDVLVLDGSDSIFYQATYNGGYLGIEFFKSADADSNVIYLGPYFPAIYNQFNKKYKIKIIKPTLDERDLYEPYRNSNYWYISGGCDQGRYTFGISRGNKFYGSIEPLQWE